VDMEVGGVDVLGRTGGGACLAEGGDCLAVAGDCLAEGVCLAAG
jgi:hypothetical protein